MRLVALGLAALLLAAGCGFSRDGSSADQDVRAAAIAAALDAADRAGAEFTMDETLVDTGGDIPKGKAVTVQAKVSGRVKAGRTLMNFKVARTNSSFTMIYAEGQVYVRHGSGVWRTSDAFGTTPLYPAVRLSLLKEAVLLSRSVSGSNLEHVAAGFGRRSSVVPEKDQLEQLLGARVTRSDEPAFLKSASAKLAFVVSTSGSNLYRAEVHMSGTEPDTGISQKIDCTADFKLTGKVAPIEVPAGAVRVDPDKILQP